MQDNKIYKETEEYVIRDIEENDYYKGYLELLSQLTHTPELTFKQFSLILQQNRKSSTIVVVYNKAEDKVIGNFKLLFDFKFTRGGAITAHLEEVVIDLNHRSKGIGKILMSLALDLAEKQGCYKIVGTTKNDKIGFYEKCGMDKKGIAFYKYFSQ